MPQSSPLILTPAIITALEDLRARAGLRPVSVTKLSERLADQAEKRKHMTRMSEQSLLIPGPFPYLVTFSIETGHPCGMARHMTMSVEREDRVPSPPAAWMVAEVLGFVGGLESCFVHLEELRGHGKAIAIIQPIAVTEGGRA